MSADLFYNVNRLTRVCLTFDTDWAPEFVLQELIDDLTARSAVATIFATNPSPVLAKAEARGQIEVAFHPNFFPGSTHGGTPHEILTTLRSWFPRSTGVRTHGLMQSSNLLRTFKDYGIEYDCSLQLYDLPFLQPFHTFFDLVRIPYHWSDASHLLEHRPFHLSSLTLDTPGLKVLDFHPMLWFLNSSSLESYESLKTLKPLTELTAEDVGPYVNQGVGIRTMFDDLCCHMSSNAIETRLLRELSGVFLRLNSRQATGRWDVPDHCLFGLNDEMHPPDSFTATPGPAD